MKRLTRPDAEWKAPKPSDYGCPTESEIRDITKKMSPELVGRFNTAAFLLLMVKERLDDKTPWKELVGLARPSSMETIDIINDKGEQVKIQAYVDRCIDKHKLPSALLRAALYLSELLEEVATVCNRNKANGSMGGRPSLGKIKSSEIATWLKSKDYSSSLNKKALVLSAMDHFCVKKTKVTNAIKEHRTHIF